MIQNESKSFRFHPILRPNPTHMNFKNSAQNFRPPTQNVAISDVQARLSKNFDFSHILHIVGVSLIWQ